MKKNTFHKYCILSIFTIGSLSFSAESTIRNNNTESYDNLMSKNKIKIDPGANYSGLDTHGYFFRGNRNTGFYYNYGTGITCFGLHKQRKCFQSKT